MEREEGSGGAQRERGSSVAPSVDRSESTSSISSAAESHWPLKTHFNAVGWFLRRKKCISWIYMTFHDFRLAE